MRAVSRRRSGKAEEEPILACIGDDNAAGRRLGAIRAARDLQDMP
jgi:hypothetical protein